MGTHPYLKGEWSLWKFAKKGGQNISNINKGLQKGGSNVGVDYWRKGKIKQIFNFAGAFVPSSSRFIFSLSRYF